MKLKKILAGTLALAMIATSLLVAPAEVKAELISANKTYDATGVEISKASLNLVSGTSETLTANALGGLLVDGSAAWNSAGGDHYALKGDFDVTIEFWNDAFIRNNDNWNNFVFEFFNDANQGYTLRADCWGWDFGIPAEYTDSIAWNWDTFRAADEALVKLHIKKVDGKTLTAHLSTDAGVIGEYTVVFTNDIPSDFYVRVGADGGKVEVRRFIDHKSSEAATEFGTITWSSSDDKVATVDANGKVTAVGAGTATITATCGSIHAECAVTVSTLQIPITGIDLTTDKAEIKVGESAQLTTTITPADTTDDKTITYTSSDDKIATVDANGKVTAVAPGTATITAKVGEFTKTVDITVPRVAITGITLKADKTDAEKGDVIKIEATINPGDATDDKTITWTSSNEKVATVDANGIVTAVGGGKATITATIGSISESVKINVNEAVTVVKNTKLDDMTIDAFLSAVSKGITLKKGHTYTVTFNTASPNATLNWETPAYAIYTSDEGAYNVGNWKELFLCRADVFGWAGGTFDNNTGSATFPSDYTWTATYPENWETWLATCKAGTEAKITAKYDGKNVVVTYEIAGAKTVTTIPHSGSAKVYLSLTGEKCNLTNINVADEYVKNVTNTGDFGMVLPVLFVLLGGAVAVVSFKKRFA